MKVIGAGFGRTGTLTLKTALERLELGPCYHMAELFEHPHHAATWSAADRGEDVDWAAFFEGWGSAVDWPACTFYQEILAAHPDAKVVLSVRDPARWYQSCTDTIYRVNNQLPQSVVLPFLPRIGAIARMADGIVWKRTFNRRFGDREHAMAVFRAHVEAVKAHVSPAQLLVFEAKQGWEPLCAFLGVPVPDEPFPHVNDKAVFQRRIQGMALVSWLILLAPVVAALSALGWLLR